MYCIHATENSVSSKRGDFQSDLSEYRDKGYIMVVGELNSRTGKRNGTIEYCREIDSGTEAYKLRDIIDRDTNDTVINKFGRKLLGYAVTQTHVS